MKYEVILGQPLIGGIPRKPVSCDSLRGPGTLIMLAFGQSNSANFGESRYHPELPVFSFYSGRCFRAEDPLPGAHGGGGSVWSRLGEMLVASGRARRVVVAAIGEGQSNIARWAPGGDLHKRLLATAEQLLAANLAPTHLLWHQGESDLGTSPATYRLAFHGMLDSLRSHGVVAPIYVAQATYCGGADSPVLRIAQSELVDSLRKIRIGPNTDYLTGPTYRYDNCHFSRSGLIAHAQAWLNALSVSE